MGYILFSVDGENTYLLFSEHADDEFATWTGVSSPNTLSCELSYRESAISTARLLELLNEEAVC